MGAVVALGGVRVQHGLPVHPQGDTIQDCLQS
jgi:hypothetical protein